MKQMLVSETSEMKMTVIKKISVWNVFWNIVNGFMKNNKAENYKRLKNYLKKLQNYEL